MQKLNAKNNIILYASKNKYDELDGAAMMDTEPVGKEFKLHHAVSYPNTIYQAMMQYIECFLSFVCFANDYHYLLKQ